MWAYFTEDRYGLYTDEIYYQFDDELTVSHSVRNSFMDNRELFLHKGIYHKMCGYAHSQLHKIKIKNPEPGSKRASAEDVDKLLTETLAVKSAADAPKEETKPCRRRKKAA
jgi:hypothetical protein